MARLSGNRAHKGNKVRDFATVSVAMLVVLALAFTFLSITNIRIAAANSTSSNVAASVNVLSYCEIGGVPNTINFGSITNGQSHDTNSLITANTIGNANGNILVYGTTWAYLSNSFDITNTLWNPTSLNSNGGNALTASPVNTLITLVPVDDATGTNNIYFGVNVPLGQAPDTYTQTITLQNSCSGSANTFSITATLTVPGQCFIQLSNTAIAFGNINPGSNTPYTSNLVVDNGLDNNVPSNILVEGSSWISGSGNFFVSNTVWATTNVAYTQTPSSTENPLQLYPGNLINTNIEIPYPPTSSSNNIYFGVAVPPGQPAGVYTQNILLENSC